MQFRDDTQRQSPILLPALVTTPVKRSSTAKRPISQLPTTTVRSLVTCMPTGHVCGGALISTPVAFNSSCSPTTTSFPVMLRYCPDDVTGRRVSDMASPVLLTRSDQDKLLQAALESSMESGVFIDTKFWAFTRRTNEGRITAPKAIYANSSLLLQSSAKEYLEKSEYLIIQPDVVI